ncbi:F-box/LRR-repeat protein 21-like isoform X2 [Agrilus planipennis]|uniref:F-box/LRR-repeat protein 21-like isoform X2 n=1 Tax=Agrilus planipennis TaxID=224129 RepID=A0A1W4XSB6_AGRPL|nr:F-box/LRR-repeat protein 21-like isoform X2 [Agrilus planipennis]
MVMESWNVLPYTLLEKVYHLLPRRDRFACSMVCQNWREALDCPSLWKTLPINLDTDLFDPTVLVLMRKYHRYFNTLELRWANNHPRLSWMQQRPDIARRACKFLMVLSETNIQLQSIKFVDWYDGRKLKKMIYHISRFLKNQKSLINVSFFMVNFNKSDCTKLLSCCLESQKSIRNLEMSYCLYPPNNSQEYVILISCLECLSNLNCLKIDYSFFINGVLEAILLSKTKTLSTLEIYVRGYPSFHETVSDSDWDKLKQQNPQIRVSFYFVSFS